MSVFNYFLYNWSWYASFIYFLKSEQTLCIDKFRTIFLCLYPQMNFYHLTPLSNSANQIDTTSRKFSFLSQNNPWVFWGLFWFGPLIQCLSKVTWNSKTQRVIGLKFQTNDIICTFKKLKLNKPCNTWINRAKTWPTHL